MILVALETDDRGNIVAQKLWVNGQDAIINVWVTNTDKQSAAMRDKAKILQSQEKKKYLQPWQEHRQAFTPFATSSCSLAVK